MTQETKRSAADREEREREVREREREGDRGRRKERIESAFVVGSTRFVVPRILLFCSFAFRFHSFRRNLTAEGRKHTQ